MQSGIHQRRLQLLFEPLSAEVQLHVVSLDIMTGQDVAVSSPRNSVTPACRTINSSAFNRLRENRLVNLPDRPSRMT